MDVHSQGTSRSLSVALRDPLIDNYTGTTDVTGMNLSRTLRWRTRAAYGGGIDQTRCGERDRPLVTPGDLDPASRDPEPTEEKAIEVVVECAAGPDTHKVMVLAAVHTPEGPEIRTVNWLQKTLQGISITDGRSLLGSNHP